MKKVKITIEVREEGAALLRGLAEFNGKSVSEYAKGLIGDAIESEAHFIGVAMVVKRVDAETHKAVFEAIAKGDGNGAKRILEAAGKQARKTS